MFCRACLASTVAEQSVRQRISLRSTGQKPVLKSKQGAFQIIETTSVFRPLCKYTKQVPHFAVVGEDADVVHNGKRVSRLVPK